MKSLKTRIQFKHRDEPQDHHRHTRATRVHRRQIPHRARLYVPAGQADLRKYKRHADHHHAEHQGFVGTGEIARKSTAIINACQYSFIFPLAPNDMHDLCTLYEKAGAINESEQEEIINNGRGRAFAVTSPANRTSIDIVATDEMQALFTL
jgi:hypothetical protein